MNRPYDTEDQPLPTEGRPRLHLIRCGDIGDDQREFEFEPLTTPAPLTVPVSPEPVPA